MKDVFYFHYVSYFNSDRSELFQADKTVTTGCVFLIAPKAPGQRLITSATGSLTGYVLKFARPILCEPSLTNFGILAIFLKPV